jgi:hypothetical protein
MTEAQRVSARAATRRWVKNNPEKERERQRRWYHKNIEKARAKCRRWKKNNPEKVLTGFRRWVEKNRHWVRKFDNKYKKEKRKLDPRFKLRCNLRIRICIALKKSRAKRFHKTEEIIGCSITYLRQYLESLFSPGMTWENHSHKGWHVDHIEPCIRFDLTDPVQQRKCFHYTNLQPLWAADNLKKGAKYVG